VQPPGDVRAEPGRRAGEEHRLAPQVFHAGRIRPV
jgi:hypothetical protein